jgi:hypothetical protein
MVFSVLYVNDGIVRLFGLGLLFLAPFGYSGNAAWAVLDLEPPALC